MSDPRHCHMDFSTFTEFVTRLLAETGPTILSVYRTPDLVVDRKADASPVTWADRRAEEIARAAIQAEWPAHGIVGEEYGEERRSAEWVWYLDPIDGTRSFTAGCPLFGTLIGVTQGGVPRFGAVHLAALGELYLGDNRTATRNGVLVRSRRGVSLAEATLLYTDPKAPAAQGKGPGFDRLVARAGTCRTWADCFGYTLVASGGADIQLDPIMYPWDLMALIPIVRGAGGVISDWEGGDPARGASCVAAGSAELHAETLAVLKETPPWP